MIRPVRILIPALILASACATPPWRSPSSSAVPAPVEGVGGGEIAPLALEEFEPLVIPTLIAEPEPELEPMILPPVEEILVIPEIIPAEPTWVWPVDSFVVTQHFRPATGQRRAHRGIDLAANTGTPILAAAPGRVTHAGWGLRGYGKWVVIDHGQGFTTVYSHCSEVLVDRDFEVAAGDVIAEMGETGNATGPHLHFELRQGEDFLDPRDLLPAR